MIFDLLFFKSFVVSYIASKWEIKMAVGYAFITVFSLCAGLCLAPFGSILSALMYGALAGALSPLVIALFIYSRTYHSP